jgi:sensor histidine kinase YesM
MPGKPDRTRPRFSLAVKFHWNVVVYWAILGFSHALAYYRESRERALQAFQLESQLAQARLQSLKMQLNPHFLFNTLNTVSQLIYEEPENADRMITHLGDLLRMSLDAGSEHQVTLRQELEFLERYLEIQKARFGDRLTTQFDIDPCLYDVLVPTLILQPLVENAIRHGVGPRSAPGRIEIHAQSQDSMLCLRVSDNGSGLPEGESAVKEGVGLGNTRARLKHLYGADQSLAFCNRPGGGLVVTLAFPLRIKSLAIAPTERESDNDHPDAHR